MSTDSELDKHLHALFGGLDTGTDFEARLRAHLRTESQADAAGRALRAQHQERDRYRKELLELTSWRRSAVRLLTLDTLGISFLLVVAVAMAWPHIGRDVVDISRQYGPYIATLLGLLIAAVPIVGMWSERTRSSIRLL